MEVELRRAANCKIMKCLVVTVCVTALLVGAAVAVVVASRSCRRPLPPPDVPVAASPAEVRVKAVERKAEPVKRGEIATASDAVAIVCGISLTGSDPSI